MHRLFGFLLVVVVASGCTPLRYVTQAAAGQERLNTGGMAIDEIVAHGYLDRKTRALLSHVAGIKQFAEANGLAKTKNYARYKWLDRPAVVWVVSACEPLAFRPMTWTFPIVGSFTYAGWFDEDEARAYANEVGKDGSDVDVRPSPAYSTLGWFDDPVLSTMIDTSDEGLGQLAETIFHETLHATFYVPGQSTLNESVASFFGEGLAGRYLAQVSGLDSPEHRAFVAGQHEDAVRSAYMREAYSALDRLYRTSLSPQDKLREKAKIIDDLREQIRAKRPINNATLIQYATYGSGKKELTALFASCGESFPRMLLALEGVRAIAAKSPQHADPARLIAPLLARPCPEPRP